MPLNSIAQTEQSLSNEVVSAIRKGDAQTLAKSFYSNIEIVLPSKTGVYSKSQAEMVMKDFFQKYPVKNFTVIHKGKKENASYAIGNYDSVNNCFRITFLTKVDGSDLLIHQLRIEKQDE